MKTIIYGASDDLIEIDGAIIDESDAPHNGTSTIIVSDGTMAVIEYAPEDEAVWRITVRQKCELFDRVVRGDDHSSKTHLDDEINTITQSMVPKYSDVLILKPGVEWIKINNKKYTCKKNDLK